ncbi:MAG TPA: DUF6680 family protein [Thermoanaerobaculia bacterium]|jgi:hypothetical protein|nr:DUF6680 family protein [Thermoanaerobaculia bacterium]
MWLTIAAILAGPMSVFLLQRWRESVREKRQRKSWVFRELMVTRGARLSQRHVDALNSIDLEFHGEEAISETWHRYFDLFSQNPRPTTEEDWADWNRKCDDALVRLLHAISHHLGYGFDEVTIRRNVYVPIAHGQLEDDLTAIRKGFVEVLSGTKRIPMDVDFAEDFKEFLANAAKQAEVAKKQPPQISGE